MGRLLLRRAIAAPADQVFAVVGDVARYPEFLPGFHRIGVEGEGATRRVRQTVGLGPATVTFHTRATYRPPERIAIHTTEPPFRHLSQLWRVEARGSARCLLVLEADYALADPLLNALFTRVYPGLQRQGLAAIARRATDPHQAPARRVFLEAITLTAASVERRE